MPGVVPLWLTALFVILVLAMAALTVVAVHARRGMRAAVGVGVALAGWLAVTAGLASAHVFEDFSRLPPRLLIAFVPAVLAIVWVCRAGAVGRLLDETPPGWLLYPQSFRIVMEIILWQLFVAGAAPAIMTFEGRNADILVGLTAPLVAWLFATRRASPSMVFWWNVAGIVILANVVVHAQLSAPTPFRIFDVTPPVTFIAYVPWIWLPAFLVPLAWALHALSMRQLRRRSVPGHVRYAGAR